VSSIAIVDGTCPRPYTAALAADGALGGTEATVARIAEGLGADVFQHNRSDEAGRYRPLAVLREADTLVVLRDPKLAIEMSDRAPHARIVLWMHDLIDPGKDRAKRLVAFAGRLADRAACIVAVSDFHRAQIDAALAGMAHRPRVVTIYNPLREDLAQVPPKSVDRDLLIYFSAPTKGLAFATFILPALRRRWPRMELAVAMPEYARSDVLTMPGVRRLGAVSQMTLLSQVAGALCTFCPNFEYPETFGLALAESNAVGTPVLAHPIGAAPEVLKDGQQLLPVPRLASAAFRLQRRYPGSEPIIGRATDLLRGFEPFIARIDAWRNGGRPDVSARVDFSQVNVLAAWRALLDEMRSQASTHVDHDRWTRSSKQ